MERLILTLQNLNAEAKVDETGIQKLDFYRA